MQAEGLPNITIKSFKYYYKRLLEGHTGYIPEADIFPVDTLPDMEALPTNLITAGEQALKKTILLKLNGGLGTSMGLSTAKSLLRVKSKYTFLDIICHQVLQENIPLVLMNSFNTRTDSLNAIKSYPDLWHGIPLDFLQNKIPKITQNDMTPVEWKDNPKLEWCPPGHGDIYVALVTSGMLDKIIAEGYKYVFVSNADNLGAVIDTTILGYFSTHDIPFLMEVADRTEADKKGGHLAKLPNGQLVLRESAQCPSDDMNHFQNVMRHQYFNTNNLWINLLALKAMLETKNHILGLPMIRNSKTVDPRDENSTTVYHLETAMGSAIAIFNDAQAIRVPRTRFAPVKTTNDLLVMQSDIYILNDDFHLVPNPARKLPQIVVDMDNQYYKLISDMEKRFSHGTPSLLNCERLEIMGDVIFGKDVVLKGKVYLINESGQPVKIEDDSILHGTYRW
ncbi:MAG: UTP--glucose-1-phosphate uridylyltransferase [Anaerolineaceae bacterium 4572_78]|nr:MAG: UTP--glucose-1-phosphate uridylyltransferase [Anaerolineaceae bacterium 4572_78]